MKNSITRHDSRRRDDRELAAHRSNRLLRRSAVCNTSFHARISTSVECAIPFFYLLRKVTNATARRRVSSNTHAPPKVRRAREFDVVRSGASRILRRRRPPGLSSRTQFHALARMFLESFRKARSLPRASPRRAITAGYDGRVGKRDERDSRMASERERLDATRHRRDGASSLSLSRRREYACDHRCAAVRSTGARLPTPGTNEYQQPGARTSMLPMCGVPCTGVRIGWRAHGARGTRA
jgi:hypothetical protein